MQLALFIIFGALAVAGALNLLLQRHPINSALSLVVVMMSLAVLYWSLGAEFLAAAQVIVYSGRDHGAVRLRDHAAERGRRRDERTAAGRPTLPGFPGRRHLLPAELRVSDRAACAGHVRTWAGI